MERVELSASGEGGEVAEIVAEADAQVPQGACGEACHRDQLEAVDQPERAQERAGWEEPPQIRVTFATGVAELEMHLQLVPTGAK